MAKKCKKSTVYCSTKLSSDCVDYTGDTLNSLDKEIDQCDLTVTQVIESFDQEVKKIKDGLDTKKLVKLCVQSIDKEDSLILIVNKLISEICTLSKELKETKEKYEDLNILDSIVNIDSDCLTGSHCSTNSTLKSLLMKMISEICTLKAQINSSGNSPIIFQP